MVKVRYEEKEVLAYLPNPGRLWEILLPDTLLLLARTKGPKYEFTVMASLKDSHPVLLHTHFTNRLVSNLISEKKIPFLANYQVMGTEPNVGQGRFDLLLKDRDTKESFYLEVKTCTLFGSELAMFPDAETQRGTRHLYELLELKEKGVKAGLLFVVMNYSCNYFLPAYHIDRAFTEAFLKVYNESPIWAIAINLAQDLSTIADVKVLSIPIEYLRSVFADRGIYMLLVEMPRDEVIAIGKLGEIFFPKGFFIYVGSAMNGLSKRLKRYRGSIKNHHWHVDYLLERAILRKIIPVITSSRLECQVADGLSNIADSLIPHFGSSDCACQSHLFYFQKNPLCNRDFINLLNFFRLEVPTIQLKTFKESS